MLEFVEEVILSPFVMFLVLAAIMVGVTSYVFRTKEYAGYALGWLVGILIIIMFEAVTGGAATTTGPEEEITFRSLNGFVVVIVSILGILTGYGGVYFIETFQRTHRRRSVSIALGTGLLVIAMYFILGLSDRTSYIIGLFGLGFTIGALTNRVLDSTPVPTRQFTQERLDGMRTQSITPADNRPPVQPPAPGNRPPAPGKPPQSDLDQQRDRFNELRRPDQRR